MRPAQANTSDPNDIRLVAGIVWLIVMAVYPTTGTITNPASYVLDVVVFGGGGIVLIRRWYQRRVLKRADSKAKLPGLPGVALVPGYLGVFAAFVAINAVFDGLWNGGLAEHRVLIIVAGVIGVFLLANCFGLARSFARGTLPSQQASAPSKPDALVPEPQPAPVPADPEPAPVLADPTPVSVLPGAEPVAAPLAEAAAAPAESKEPADFLRTDSRTAWAYRRYLTQRRPGGIDTAMGARLLALVEPGDHVELFLDAVISPTGGALNAIDLERPSPTPIVAVRTLRAWILLHREHADDTVIPGRADGGWSVTSSRATAWPHTGWATTLESADGADLAIKVFLDDREGLDATIIEEGAGPHIRRLPETDAVPGVPDAADLLAAAPESEPESAPVLPADWRAAEDIAAHHMRVLGFADAEKTAGGRDGGLDITSAHAVAQVKMMALPVGAPPVQQLRGTRPFVEHHIFYSTSGYTAAALAAADEIVVALFKIDRDGTVTEANAAASDLAVSGRGGTAPAPSPERLVERYAERLAARVLAAVQRVDHDKAQLDERYPGQYQRLLRYPHQALRNLDDRPETFTSLRAALIYFHHTELLAHVFFQELGIPYPEGNLVEEDPLDSYYD
ncbi:restriction endonuclease [Actinoplanes sp. HUAS TT8]|uniref:restriction endonuclease n=1 Tax=Actinoplanes sp. HUAS TT8 TaxID=3447453 RepID=UPI003F51ED22